MRLPPGHAALHDCRCEHEHFVDVGHPQASVVPPRLLASKVSPFVLTSETFPNPDSPTPYTTYSPCNDAIESLVTFNQRIEAIAGCVARSMSRRRGERRRVEF